MSLIGIDVKNGLPKNPNKSHRLGWGLAALVATSAVAAINYGKLPEPSAADQKSMIWMIKQANTNKVAGITCTDRDGDGEYKLAPLGAPLAKEYIAEVERGDIAGCELYGSNAANLTPQ